MAALRVIAQDIPTRRYVPRNPIARSVLRTAHAVQEPVATPHPVIPHYVPQYGHPLPKHTKARSFYHRPYSYDDLDLIYIRHPRHYYSYHRPYSYDDLDLLNYRRHYRRPYFYHDHDIADTYRRHHLYHSLHPSSADLDLYTTHHYRPYSSVVKVGLPHYRHPYIYDDLEYPDYSIYRSFVKVEEWTLQTSLNSFSAWLISLLVWNKTISINNTDCTMQSILSLIIWKVMNFEASAYLRAVLFRRTLGFISHEPNSYWNLWYTHPSDHHLLRCECSFTQTNLQKSFPAWLFSVGHKPFCCICMLMSMLFYSFKAYMIVMCSKTGDRSQNTVSDYNIIYIMVYIGDTDQNRKCL